MQKDTSAQPQRQDRDYDVTAQSGSLSSHDFDADWIGWGDVCRRRFEIVRSWDIVLGEVRPKLISGEIGTLIRAVTFKTHEIRDHVLLSPAEFWIDVEISSRPGLLPDDVRWRKKKQQENALPPWWVLDAWHYFYLRRADVNQKWFFIDEPNQSAKAVIKNKASTRGPKFQERWRALAAVGLLYEVALDHIPDDVSIAEICENLSQLCVNKLGDDAPGDTSMKNWVTELLRAAREIKSPSNNSD